MKFDLNDYYYFVHVVEKQGYTAAANALQMPKSRLSRHVAQLEERLGVRLLQRTSRNITITQQGQHFYQHARKLVDAMELAESAMQNAEGNLCGKVVISCSVGLAQYALSELVIEFVKLHPMIQIEQRVANMMVNLIAEGIDIAIRGHSTNLPDSTLIQRVIARVNWPLYASPNYVSGTESISQPDALSHCKFLKLGNFNQQNTISLLQENGHEIVQTVLPVLCSDDMATLKRAAIAGIGITSLPSYVCHHEEQQGALVRVLPEWYTQTANLSLVMPSRSGVPAHIKAFSDFLRERLPPMVEA